MDSSSELIDLLIKQDPVSVHQWLNEVWEGTQTIPADFHWKHIAAAMEVLAKWGQGKTSLKPDREWASITASLFEYLIKIVDPSEKSFFQERLIELKAYCIAHLGAVEGDPLLDAQQLLLWFEKTLPFTLEEVERKILSTKDLDFIEIGHLLDIKNRLIWLQWLWDRGLLYNNEAVEKWLAIREKLP